MRNKLRCLLVLLICCSCSHTGGAESRAADDAAINQLARPDADARLAATLKELEDLDAKIRSAESRRDSFQGQASTDVTKQDKLEGAEAELQSLQGKRSALLHRQHVIEGRLRELGAGDESSY